MPLTVIQGFIELYRVLGLGLPLAYSRHIRHSLNSSKAGYIGDYIADCYRGY